MAYNWYTDAIESVCMTDKPLENGLNHTHEGICTEQQIWNTQKLKIFNTEALFFQQQQEWAQIHKMDQVGLL